MLLKIVKYNYYPILHQYILDFFPKESYLMKYHLLFSKYNLLVIMIFIQHFFMYEENLNLKI